MQKSDEATDVVALLTSRSLNRPWILYETGVAKELSRTGLNSAPSDIDYLYVSISEDDERSTRNHFSLFSVLMLRRRSCASSSAFKHGQQQAESRMINRAQSLKEQRCFWLKLFEEIR